MEGTPESLFFLSSIGVCSGLSHWKHTEQNNVKYQMCGIAVMKVLVLILMGIVTIGGLHQIVWDEIRQSRRADRVAQEPPEAEADAKLPITPIQQEADKCTNSAHLSHQS